MVALLSLPLAGCESASVEDFCNQRCLCESCNAAEQQQCSADGDAERTLFESNGCDYDAFLECAVDTSTCADTGISFATTCTDKLMDSCDTPPAQ